MARMPITMMGFRCDRCQHEWIPRGGTEEGPRILSGVPQLPMNQPHKKPPMTYDDFKLKIGRVLKDQSKPLTWTEIRTAAALPQAFPNNQWVHRMEKDIGLTRRRESDGTIRWSLKEPNLDLVERAPAQTPDQVTPRSRGKQGAVE